jgi:hypothetical protein
MLDFENGGVQKKRKEGENKKEWVYIVEIKV